MLESTPLLSECVAEYSNNNTPFMQKEPYRTPSGYTPLQSVRDIYGTKVTTSDGRQLYTNGVKTGSDINYIMNMVKLPKFGPDLPVEKSLDYLLPEKQPFLRKLPEVKVDYTPPDQIFGSYNFIKKEVPKYLADYSLTKNSNDPCSSFLGKRDTF